jgi:hypothetical protein
MFGPRATSAIRGAFELFLGRREALARFDMSFEGFWHSFGAVIYVLPLFAIGASVEYRMLLTDTIAEDPSGSLFVAARLVDFGISWVAMPAILALLAPRLGITRTYVSYIVVRNWALIVSSTPQAVISIVQGLDLISIEVASLLSLVVLGVMLRYHYQIVRWTLGRPAGFSAALVAADFILGFVITQIVDQLFGI